MVQEEKNSPSMWWGLDCGTGRKNSPSVGTGAWTIVQGERIDRLGGGGEVWTMVQGERI